MSQNRELIGHLVLKAASGHFLSGEEAMVLADAVVRQAEILSKVNEIAVGQGAAENTGWALVAKITDRDYEVLNET